MLNQIIHTPEGVRDIYGNELLEKKYIKEKLNNIFHLRGYNPIETPSFEYLDMYYNEKDLTDTKDMFKFFDNNGNILSLRPDFTPAVCRCAAKYFSDSPLPLRLCYEGNTFINKSEHQGKLKETTQMGVELICKDSYADLDAEMVCLSIEALKSLNLEDFQVVIGEVSYFRSICKSIDFIDNEFETFKEYVSLKNYFGARELLENKNVDKSIIDALLGVSDIKNIEELREVKANTNNTDALKAIERLEQLYEIIQSMGFEKYVSFDLALLNKFNYYSGVLFRVYTHGVGDAIVKGGRYDELLPKFGTNNSAIGLVFLIEEIQSALNMQKLQPTIENSGTMVVYNSSNRIKALNYLNELREKNTVCFGIYKEDDKDESWYKEYSKSNGYNEPVFFI